MPAVAPASLPLPNPAAGAPKAAAPAGETPESFAFALTEVVQSPAAPADGAAPETALISQDSAPGKPAGGSDDDPQAAAAIGAAALDLTALLAARVPAPPPPSAAPGEPAAVAQGSVTSATARTPGGAQLPVPGGGTAVSVRDAPPSASEVQTPVPAAAPNGEAPSPDSQKANQRQEPLAPPRIDPAPSARLPKAEDAGKVTARQAPPAAADQPSAFLRPVSGPGSPTTDSPATPTNPPAAGQGPVIIESVLKVAPENPFSERPAGTPHTPASAPAAQPAAGDSSGNHPADLSGSQSGPYQAPAAPELEEKGTRLEAAGPGKAEASQEGPAPAAQPQQASQAAPAAQAHAGEQTSTRVSVWNVPDHVAKVAAQLNPGERTEVRLRLDPPTLGEVRVEISSSERGISVQMVAHSAEAADLLAESQRQLRQELGRQGLTLASFSASTSGQGGHQPAQRDPESFRGAFPHSTAMPGTAAEPAAPLPRMAPRAGTRYLDAQV